jgi:hypothetical protein
MLFIMNNLRNICFIFCFAFSISAYAGDCTRYSDGVFNYSIRLPQGWNNTYREIGNKHVLGSKRKGGAEICVSASQFNDDEKLKWDSWMKSYVMGIGHEIRSIIETKEIPAGTDATVKLIVFDYSSRIGRMLQRTMLMKYSDTILVVECRAPVRTFGRYTDLFNTVMSSVDLSGSIEGENVEVLKAAETRTQKRIHIKKDTERKKIIEKKVTPARKPITSEEVKPYKETIKPEELKPDSKTIKPKEVKPEIETKKGEEAKPDTEKAVDPETKKMIEAGLKKIQELEQKSIIEKMDEQ